ncbi:hypothetical protein ROZALSC1DRAFT_30712, partial [Rozella allomycis CSF55]
MIVCLFKHNFIVADANQIWYVVDSNGEIKYRTRVERPFVFFSYYEAKDYIIAVTNECSFLIYNIKYDNEGNTIRQIRQCHSNTTFCRMLETNSKIYLDGLKLSTITETTKESLNRFQILLIIDHTIMLINPITFQIEAKFELPQNLEYSKILLSDLECPFEVDICFLNTPNSAIECVTISKSTESMRLEIYDNKSKWNINEAMKQVKIAESSSSNQRKTSNDKPVTFKTKIKSSGYGNRAVNKSKKEKAKAKENGSKVHKDHLQYTMKAPNLTNFLKFSLLDKRIANETQSGKVTCQAFSNTGKFFYTDQNSLIKGFKSEKCISTSKEAAYFCQMDFTENDKLCLLTLSNGDFHLVSTEGFNNEPLIQFSSKIKKKSIDLSEPCLPQTRFILNDQLLINSNENKLSIFNYKINKRLNDIEKPVNDLNHIAESS